MLEKAAARLGIELPLCFSFSILMSCANIHTSLLENCFYSVIVADEFLSIFELNSLYIIEIL